ncbi:MAG TPA: magnesium/cobalt transporter CorA [Candidatus Krumholzibacteria bacterium]|nr:magnesium/cobalt transporter CorA [Candidatus Krumholzibacteria bacterium]HPD72698.1 magnesium/cobalt transporter CorA [Candidatus Krumholzibacteria bacterium]HRY40370.1 magnesium/cobalt transporter CorA [Candidatus Krumholzibacteria bacterium]
MVQMFRGRQEKIGAAPGTMVYVGQDRPQPVTVTVIDYGPERFEERELPTPEDATPYRESTSISWLNVDGLQDVDYLRRVCEAFHLHPLVQEDIVNTHQRPKLEDYEDYLYLVCHMLTFNEATQRVESEQVSLVVGPRWVLSFQEQGGDVFDGVRERIRHGKGRVRHLSAGYLAYALLDAVVDNYFAIIERIGELVEGIEEGLLDGPQDSRLSSIHELKREMILMRRAVWPLRELVGGLQRGESYLVQPDLQVYFRDLHDHTIQVADAVESYRDILSGLQDLYLSTLSNHMNEVMKVLTIVGTIFIPMTFLAGVYGMNFRYLPELGWKWGYLGFWLVILAIGGGMLAFFRRRGWL